MEIENFVGGFGVDRSTNFSCETCINLIPVKGDGKLSMLMGTAGTTKFNTNDVDGGVRAMIVASNDILYVVCGDMFYAIYSDNYVYIGTIDTHEGTVNLADNGHQILIATGETGYVYEYNLETFTQITVDGWRGSNQAVYLDGRFVALENDTGVFYWSALNNGLAWDALDFKSAEGLPDKAVALQVKQRQLFIFGTTSTEVYFISVNAADPLDIFQRSQGSLVEYGASSTHPSVSSRSVCKLDDNICFVATNEHGGLGVAIIDGYQPKKISTRIIDQLLNECIDKNITAYTYTHEGKSFYCLNLSNLDYTLVYDSTSGLWHQRNWWNGDSFEKHYSDFYVYYKGKHLVGSRQDSDIQQLSYSVFTDKNNIILRERTTQRVGDAVARGICTGIQLVAEVGVGLEDNIEPEVTLQFSDDGGHSFCPEKSAGMGKIGEYTRRIRWLRLGQFRQRVVRFRSISPVKQCWLNAYIEVE